MYTCSYQSTQISIYLLNFPYLTICLSSHSSTHISANLSIHLPNYLLPVTCRLSLAYLSTNPPIFLLTHLYLPIYTPFYQQLLYLSLVTLATGIEHPMDI